MPDHPDERTALLVSTNGPRALDPRPLPEIEPAAERVRAQAGFNFALPDLPDEPTKAAYRLVVLLQALVSTTSSSQTEPWEVWTKEARDTAVSRELEAQVMALWKELLDGGLAADLETILWTAFPRNDGEPSSIRAIKLLAHPKAPVEILTHRLVDLHLHSAWENGVTIRPTSTTFTQIALRILDSCSTPCVVHLINTIFDVVYFSNLINYLVDPPRKSVITDGYIYDYGWRGALLMVYAFTSMFRPPTIRLLPNIFIFLAFLFCLPSVPMAGDGTFDALLFGTLFFIITWFFTPFTPSVYFHTPSLALATLLWRGFTRAFMPVMAFFLPVFVIAFSLLSASLSDTLFRSFGSVEQLPAPIETRAGFLTLFSVVVVLAASATIMLVLIVPTNALHGPSNRQAWDLYGPGIGAEARRLFLNTILAYSPQTPTSVPVFPPPFNVLVLMLVQIPIWLFGLIAARETRTLQDKAERISWRVFIGPFAVPLSGIGVLLRLLFGTAISTWDMLSAHLCIMRRGPKGQIRYADPPAELPASIEGKLRHLSEFYTRVMLTFVIRDLSLLLNKFAKSCKK